MYDVDKQRAIDFLSHGVYVFSLVLCARVYMRVCGVCMGVWCVRAFAHVIWASITPSTSYRTVCMYSMFMCVCVCVCVCVDGCFFSPTNRKT